MREYKNRDRQSRERATELVAVLSRIAPDRAAYLVAEDVRKLQQQARIIHRVAERECNGVPHPTERYPNGEPAMKWDDADQQAADLERDKASVTARGLLVPYKGLVTVQGDPRGPCLFISLPGEKGDDLGGRGFGVW